MRTSLACLLLALLGACGERAIPPATPGAPPVATFSIVARDASTGELGIAVASRVLAVGAVVPWARADVGAVATQAFANVAWGPDALDRMAAGATAQEALDALVAADPRRARRQMGLVDAEGRAAAYTGERCLPWAGHEVGEGWCAQGNILAGPEVLAAMGRAFEGARGVEDGDLAAALLAALRAGQLAGGDRRGRQSAALLVVRAGGGYAGGNDRFIDLRVDDHAQPIEELARLLALHRDLFANAHRRGGGERR